MNSRVLLRVMGSLPVRPMQMAVAVVLLGISVTGLRAGDIKGRVIIRKPQTVNTTIVSQSIIRKYVRKMPDSYRTPEMTMNGSTDVVVYVDDLLLTDHVEKSPPAVMDQTSEKFVPHVLPILVGTRVKFLNSDEVYHNVFSFSKTKTFDLGRYAKGEYRFVTFDKPGVVKVYCDIHTHMNAFILVLKNPYFAKVDSKERFEIKNVPPGNYTLKAWYGRSPEKSVKITVDRVGTTHVNFEFP